MPGQPLPALRDLVDDLRNGTRGLLDYINATCDHVDACEPEVAALLPEPGRRERLEAEARDLLARYPDSAARPPLFGVLMGVKDLFHVTGFETRAGSALPPHWFAGDEGPVIQALRAAGALMLGKTVATEFAFADPGPTRNPHHLEHTPGGSSSGSAAAVAAGYCPLALGTQTIGSIARPASYCGVTGFKPTYGRLSTAGCVPFSASVDHVGFFVSKLDDVDVVARCLWSDWGNIEPAHSGAAAKRVGVPTGAFLAQADNVMVGAFESWLDALRAAGYTVIETDLFPDWDDWVELHYDLIAAEMAAYHRPWFAACAAQYQSASRALIERGEAVSAERLAEARAGQLRLRERVEQQRLSQELCAWVTPSATGPAPHGLASTGNPRMNLPWSYTGLPTVTVPLPDRSDAGLPLGVQWVGGWAEDERLIQTARRAEASLRA